MFNVWVDYPSFQEEVDVVKSTTSGTSVEVKNVMTADEITLYQQLVRKIPVADNVIEYAVRLASKTRNNPDAPEVVKNYISWGAGPRASQYLVIGAKCHALLRGKFSPDMEDVNAIALPILRHRIVRNYKAEAEGYSVEKIVEALLEKA
jgi:MoxR-like ATPase